jgi:hypothetical protein
MRTAFWAVVALATAGVAVVPAEAKADTRFGIGIVVGSDYRYGYRDGYRDAYRNGYDRGAQDGAEHGFKDGRRSKGFSVWQHGEYRDADHGYHGWMGSRWDYRAGYRRGYEASYRRAYAAAGPSYRDRDDRYRYRERYENGRYGRDGDDRMIYEEDPRYRDPR